jgi:hypothetical protein
MTRTKNELVPILFRYFMVASLMRQEFDEHLNNHSEQAAIGGDPTAIVVSKGWIKMCLWYGMLFVVVEGWRQAQLSDPEIDQLLASPNTELLRRFRNGMFHFQEDQWLPSKLSDFFAPSNKTVDWVRALTKAFRRYLLAEMNRISPPLVAP